MMRSITRGCGAGAVGTTALHAVTYADMAVRGRPPSSTPEDMVDRLTARLGHPVRGDEPQRSHRLSGLGALSGIAVGCGIGSVVSLWRSAGVRPPVWLGAVVTGSLAMAVTNVPMARLQVTDPRTWSAADWASDVVPHLLYGLVTYGIVAAGDGQPTRSQQAGDWRRGRGRDREDGEA